MLVKEIMDTRNPFIYDDEPATKARALIRELGLRILPVTDKNKHLVGKVSRRDAMTISSAVSGIRAKGIMTPARYIAKPGDDVVVTVKAMLKEDVWYAPVVTSENDGTYLGVVGLENYIEALIRDKPEKLAMDASEIMTSGVVCVSPDDETDNLWKLMREKNLAGLPVTNKGKLVGMVTQKDLLDRGSAMPTFESQKGRFLAPQKVSSLMQSQVVSVEPSIKAIRIAKILVSKRVGRVPVVNEKQQLVGIVDREDIAKVLLK